MKGNVVKMKPRKGGMKDLKDKGYRFKGRDPVLDEVCRAMLDDGRSLTRIADKSGVSTTTLNNWLTGKTRNALRSTMNAVMEKGLGKKWVGWR